jgi:cobalt-zinc-cadmium efflux system protein
VINSIAVAKTHKGTGVNERAISLHLLEDVLGWVAVLVGSLFVYFFKWYFVDCLLSVLIAGFLLFESTKNIKNIFTILLEKTPDNIDVAGFRARVEGLSEVENVHHLHVWSLDGEKTMATVHVKLCDCADFSSFEKVKATVETFARDFSIEHITIQIDTGNCQGEMPCDL